LKSRWIEYRGGGGRRLSHVDEREREKEREATAEALKPDDSDNAPGTEEFLTGLSLREPDVTKTRGTSRFNLTFEPKA